jgi:hypothetical protein
MGRIAGCELQHNQHSNTLISGSLQVSLEVEEEAHSTPTKEAPKDAPTIQVRYWECRANFC